ASPAAGCNAGDDGSDRTKLEWLSRQDAQAGQQRIQALAVGATYSKDDSLQIVDRSNSVQAVNGAGRDQHQLFAKGLLTLQFRVIDRAHDKRTLKLTVDDALDQAASGAGTNHRANVRVGLGKLCDQPGQT